MAVENARLAIRSRIASRAGLAERFEALQDELGLPELPQRLECFDISHTMGEATVASCVVFDPEGPVKSAYRRFNITDITPGDDYAAMRQALERRYKRLKAGEGKLPDLLFIDGGKGQVAGALAVLEELQVEGIQIIGVAKGVTRRPGMETLIREDGSAVHLAPDSPALHLIQQIRDEAHRFAITGHRQRRGKARTTSPLERIPGIGPKRRQRLLKQFGGLRGLSRASVEELSRVEGVSRALAQEIYDMFHAE
jgi:excinuclease ABC subunit C